MKKKGILTVVSGFSGAGKGTIMKSLIEKYPYFLSVSATTRSPREGEIDGVHYFFRTREEFETMIEQNQLIEWAEYVGNYYGTPKEAVQKQLDEGKDVVLEIEMQGGMQVKKLFPDALLLFITTPSADVLKERLVGRGTETEEVINKRLARAAEEAEYMDKYDYIIVNDVLEEAVEQVHNTIASTHNQTIQCADYIQAMKDDLMRFSKGE